MLTHKFMPLPRSVTATIKGFAASILLLNAVAAQGADTLEKVFSVSKATVQNSQQAQAKIDGIAGQTNDLLQDFKQVSKEIEGLRVYNAQLETRIKTSLSA